MQGLITNKVNSNLLLPLLLRLLLTTAALTRPASASATFPSDCSWWHLSSSGTGSYDTYDLVTSCEVTDDPRNAGKVTGTLDLNACVGVARDTHVLVWETK